VQELKEKSSPCHAQSAPDQDAATQFTAEDEARVDEELATLRTNIQQARSRPCSCIFSYKLCMRWTVHACVRWGWHAYMRGASF
jgi:hypothetical protein